MAPAGAGEGPGGRNSQGRPGGCPREREAAALAASDLVVWASLGLLNLALAVLVGSVRPRRAANTVAVVLFAANGAFGARVALDQVLPLGAVAQPLDIALTVPTFAGLLVFPFLFPHRRLAPRHERLLLAAASGMVLVSWLLLLVAPEAILPNNPFSPGLAVLGYGPLVLGLALGTFLMLDTYLASPSRILRDLAAIVLAAYVLKAASTAVLLANSVRGLTDLPGRTPGVVLLGWEALLLVAVVAVPLAMGVARWRARHRGPGPGARGGRADAFVLAFVPLGLLAPSLLGDLEYMLVRPLLFAYAILQYQMLDVEARRQMPAVVAAIGAGAVALFVVAARALEGAGLEPSVAAGLGAGVTALAGGALAWPLLRRLVAEDGGAPGARSTALYRAALEESAAAARDGDSSSRRVMAALRTRLSISEREHAAMEAEVHALFGRGATGLVPGREFLGRYRVERPLGEGGFGRAFLAHDTHVDRRVVLKAARAPSAEETRRMLREARVVSRLQHPHVVALHDVEEVAGDCILVLEHMDGGSLADRLRRGPLPLAEALAMADGVLGALDAAHAEGVVHRDVKPANIMFTRDGRAKLGDFGVAWQDGDSGTAGASSAGGRHPGSVRYMSPEQVRGMPLDARSDVYAVGVVLYEALAGRAYLDVQGLPDFDVRVAILEDPPQLPLAGLPRGVGEVLAQTLAKDPARRPQSAAELRRLLAQAATQG